MFVPSLTKWIDTVDQIAMPVRHVNNVATYGLTSYINNCLEYCVILKLTRKGGGDLAVLLLNAQ